MQILLLLALSILVTYSSLAYADKPELNKRHYPSSDIQLDIVEAELNAITRSALGQTSLDVDCKDVNIGNTGDSDPFKHGGFGDTEIAVTNVTVYNICR